MAGPQKEHSLELPFERGVVPAQEWSYPEQLCRSPLVSVVMLTYNHGAHLARSIEGVLAQQTDFEFEILIGEDCSTDDTPAVARRFLADHGDSVRLISAEQNVGARCNAFRCEQLCRGKYIAYCEGDDYWHETGKLQQQVDFLEANPEYGLVYTNADTVEVSTGKRKESAIPYREELCDSDDAYVQQLTGVMIIWPVTTCVRTELVRGLVRECPELTDTSYAMGDTQRYLEVARRARIKYMPVSTATRNLLPESTTRSKDILKRARFARSSERLILHYLEKYPLSREYDRQVRDWVARRALRFAYLCRDRAHAVEAFRALRAVRARIPFRYRLYRMGAENMLAHGLVRLVLKAAAR